MVVGLAELEDLKTLTFIHFSSCEILTSSGNEAANAAELRIPTLSAECWAAKRNIQLMRSETFSTGTD